MRQTKDKKTVISWVLILSIMTANLNVPLMAAEQTQTYIADSGNDIQKNNITNEENDSLENQVSENQTSENEIPDSALLENQISDNQVSENEISENEVSGNMVSENAVSGNEIGIFDLTKAKQALSEILNQKDIMALVYLTDSLDVRKEPASDSQSVKKVKSGQLVFIQDVAIGLDDGSIWYYVKIADTDIYGYLPRYYLACSDELLLEWEKEYMGELSTYENAVGGDTSEEIEAFPGSYRNKLYSLKSLHPNWVFVEYAPGIDWNDAINKQYEDNHSWIWYTAPSEYKEGTADTKWNYASKKGIAYYMDPRNFLNESNLFQFEQLTYNKDYHTEAAVKSLLSGSFMSGEIPRDDGESKIRTYANEFYSLGASETLKVSPFHLAARVFLEQGDGKSPLISGKYPGYENLYNYFNIGASGSGEAVIISGLTKARSYKWDRRYKSLAGGATFIGKGYIGIGQDTIYLQKFDIPSLADGTSLHQYQQNIQAPLVEGNKIKGAYQAAGKLNSVFVFKIPVYEGMPNAVSLSATSKTMNKGTEYQLTGSMNGSKMDASNFTWSSSDASIASVSSTGLVKAIAVGANGVKGTAIITAVDKSDSENVATCKITTVSPLTSIQLSLSQNAVERFQTFDLQVSYLPEDTTDNRTVTWSTKNSGIAWIQSKTNNNGINDKCSVSTNTLGTTSITAKVGTKTATCEVAVRAVIKNIDFENEFITIYDGQAQKLQVNYEPVYTSDEIQFDWSSKDDKIASVDNGVVTGVGVGSTIITAKFVNGMGEMKQANCTVSVNKCKVQYYDADGKQFIDVDDKEYGSTYGSPPKITEPDHTVFAGWYTEKGGQGTKVSEEDLVVGTVSLYPYFLELDKGFTVKPIGNQVYTGSAIVPGVNVYDKDTLLKLNQDYTIAYKNNKNVNNEGSTSYPYVIVKGKGNYAGSQTVSFNIIQKNIDCADIKVDDIFVAYNGKVIKSVPVVMQGNTKLKQNTHYKVSYPSLSKEYAYQQPGVYPVLLEGIGNYTGSRLIYEVITKKVLASKLTVAKVQNQTYTGNDIEPKLTVKYGKILLTEGTHYTVDYGNDNIGIGKKTLTIHGISSGGYLGSKSVAYNIVGRDIRKVKVSGIEAKEYTNNYPEKGIVQDKYSLIYADLVLLTEDVDYEVSYLKNKQAGTATIIFTGKNGYSGILKKTFKITKSVLSASMNIAMSNGSNPFAMTYLKDASKPELIISSNGIALTKNVDYTLSYQNCSAVNDGSNPLKQPTIIIKGKGNYSGTLSCNYKITQADFKNAVVTALDATYSPKAGKWKSSPVVTDTNGKKLKVGSDYEKTISYNYVENTVLEDEAKTVRLAGSTVEITDIPPAGTKIQVRVTGRGNYSSDSITCIYRITQSSIAKASVNVKSQIYNKDKAASTEGITVSQNDIVIKLGKVELQHEDYVIVPNSFTNNKTKGTASFTIQGIGNYGGTKKVTFKITSFPIIWWWGA